MDNRRGNKSSTETLLLGGVTGCCCSSLWLCVYFGCRMMSAKGSLFIQSEKMRTIMLG